MSGIRLFNRSAVKEHALKCSVAKRAGKFTRVGEEFFEELAGDVEALIREALVKAFIEPSDFVQPADGARFVTGDLLDRLGEAVNAALPRMIQRKVMRQPSVGVTLGRTR